MCPSVALSDDKLTSLKLHGVHAVDNLLDLGGVKVLSEVILKNCIFNKLPRAAK